jgi:hypothetical protein
MAHEQAPQAKASAKKEPTAKEREAERSKRDLSITLSERYRDYMLALAARDQFDLKRDEAVKSAFHAHDHERLLALIGEAREQLGCEPVFIEPEKVITSPKMLEPTKQEAEKKITPLTKREAILRKREGTRLYALTRYEKHQKKFGEKI